MHISYLTRKVYFSCSLKKDQGKDITQSPVYKMVHGLDGEKSKPRRGVADEGKRRAGCESSTGASGYTATKHGVSFRVLQWLTDTEDVERVDIGTDKDDDDDDDNNNNNIIIITTDRVLRNYLD